MQPEAPTTRLGAVQLVKLLYMRKCTVKVGPNLEVGAMGLHDRLEYKIREDKDIVAEVPFVRWVCRKMAHWGIPDLSVPSMVNTEQHLCIYAFSWHRPPGRTSDRLRLEDRPLTQVESKSLPRFGELMANMERIRQLSPPSHLHQQSKSRPMLGAVFRRTTAALIQHGPQLHHIEVFSPKTNGHLREQAQVRERALSRPADGKSER